MGMRSRRLAAMGLAAVIGCSAFLAGCGGTSGSGSSESADTTAESTEAADDGADAGQAAEEDTAEEDAAEETAAEPTETVEFTMIPVSGPDEMVTFQDWGDSPAIHYWLDQTWNGKKIAMTFNNPPADSLVEYFNTIMATGEYADMMFAGFLTETPLSLYEQGIVLDMTDYVAQYMPNYQAWLDAHPEIHDRLYTATEDGDKLLAISCVSDSVDNPWEGYLYRRDWIVKYGKDADGNAFTGGWNEDKTEWTDDVVFPSGGTDPIYISDWEWMFDIFQTALSEEGIEDGYAFQQVPRGYMTTGDVVTGFGGIAPGWYQTRDGEIRYGMTDDAAQMRAYVDCMKSWYDKGYLRSNFDEESLDTLFFMLDQPATYAGKVGMWHGLSNLAGNAIDNGEGATVGICLGIAPQPINDIYGDESAQNQDPWVFYGAGSLINGQVVFTNKAAEKDLETMLTAIDWLYSGEGSELASFGVSDELQAEIADPELTKAGLNGTYSKQENASGDMEYVIEPTIVGNLIDYNFERLELGNLIRDNVNKGETPWYLEQIKNTKKYQGITDISHIAGRLSADDTQEMALISTQAQTYLDSEIANMITGRTELNDETWQTLVDTVKGYGVDTVTEKLNAVK